MFQEFHKGGAEPVVPVAEKVEDTGYLEIGAEAGAGDGAEDTGYLEIGAEAGDGAEVPAVDTANLGADGAGDSEGDSDEDNEDNGSGAGDGAGSKDANLGDSEGAGVLAKAARTAKKAISQVGNLLNPSNPVPEPTVKVTLLLGPGNSDEEISVSKGTTVRELKNRVDFPPNVLRLDKTTPGDLIDTGNRNNTMNADLSVNEDDIIDKDITYVVIYDTPPQEGGAKRTQKGGNDDTAIAKQLYDIIIKVYTQDSLDPEAIKTNLCVLLNTDPKIDGLVLPTECNNTRSNQPTYDELGSTNQNQNPNQKPNQNRYYDVAPINQTGGKKKVLFMLSSHGSKITNEDERDNYKELVEKTADGILTTVGDDSGEEVYIGYDGDGAGAPITYLFYKVIQKLITAGKSVTPMISQFSKYMPNEEQLKSNLNNTYKFFEDDNVEKIKNVKETLEETIRIHYTVGSDSQEKPDAKNIYVKVDVGAGSYPKKEKNETPPENNDNYKYEIKDDHFKVTLTEKGEESKNDKSKTLPPPFDDKRSECFGGITYENEGNKKLVGSSAAWKEYFSQKLIKFDSIYYVPVWSEDIKEYEGSITKQTGENLNLFASDPNVTLLEGLVKRKGTSTGGSKKSKKNKRGGSSKKRKTLKKQRK